MSSSEVKIFFCKSCKGTDHKRRTNKLCPNSRWGKIRLAEQIEAAERKKENFKQINENLKVFENFIERYNITMDKLAPAYCSNWMEINLYSGNTREWKLDYYLQKKLFDLHYDIASKVYGTSFNNNDISYLDDVSERTKIIYGIVGSNAGEIWYNKSYEPSYDKVHYGTKQLLKLWDVTIETKNEIL